MNFRGRCFRAHTPKWAHQPLSGGGSLDGGRFNAKNDEALYLALHPFTSILEVMQGLSNRLSACLLCEYDVEVDNVVDLRTDADCSTAGVSRGDLACHWRLFRTLGMTVPSWEVANRFRTAGAPGILVPSFAPDSDPGRDFNLVLFMAGGVLPGKVTVHDPGKRLPRDAASWGA